ncbi:hypothetical protein DFR86_05165 [Acidianus sulfidivorans JP7]|uniref:NurA domain-containing protein n=1 Tax=Acidianus sulfidivorans JP7 TaxID=619593 RepID=A0A2U9ILS1_9CREN|nr:DNA double-strand break repair nuclease NurA [Acidianus sulfidivorans]AWR97009.1 hypothetical protein DFR86_05165 [Acidianus sulfidivorans JP7]
MPSQQNIMEILNDVVIKYISSYLSYSYDNNPSRINENNDFIKEVNINHNCQDKIYAVDGSSRSFVSGKGIISVSSVAISSNYIPIYGVYPSLDGEKELDLKEPFIAVASSLYETSKLDPYLYSNKYVSSISITGEPFNSLEDLDKIEGEIRSILETKALALVKGKGKIIVDGPLFPSYLYFSSKFKEKLLLERKNILDENFIGIVKRVDKSRVLINTLDNNLKEKIYQKFKIDINAFLSDESFLLSLIRFNYNPPYKILRIGPITKEILNTKIYMYYLIIPFHSYIPKFSILRIETLTDKEDLISLISSLNITKDGIPTILALADSKAKKTSLALYRYIVSIAERIGIQSSFYSRLSVI